MIDMYRDGETVDLVVHAVFLTRTIRGHLYEIIHASRVDQADVPRVTVCRIVPILFGAHDFTIVGRTYRTSLLRIRPSDDWTMPREMGDVRRFDTRHRFFTRSMIRLGDRT